jgi:hypothetical protein
VKLKLSSFQVEVRSAIKVGSRKGSNESKASPSTDLKDGDSFFHFRIPWREKKVKIE